MWFSHQLVMMISKHELTLRLVETEIPKMVLLGPNSDCFLSAYANLLFIHPFFSRTPDSGQPASTLQKGWSSVVGVQGQIHGYTDIIFFQQFQFSHNLQASYTVFSPIVHQPNQLHNGKSQRSGTLVFLFSFKRYRFYIPRTLMSGARDPSVGVGTPGRAGFGTLGKDS